MAKSFVAFEASGLKELLRGLDKVEESIVEGLDQEIDASGKTIARDAKRGVPKNTGTLANAISVEKKGKLDYEVVAQKHYAPYVEFGTGGLVDVPAGLEDYAIQFKGAGIKEVNLPPHPYLFPAYEEERKKLIDRIKKTLLNNAKRGITVIMPGNSNITGTTTI
jgi:HK97 gp10 family phage protein